MKNKFFNFLRFMAETGITALGACYLGLAVIWNLPFGEQIRDTALVLSTCLGIFVGVSRAAYNKKNNVSQIPDDKINEDAKEQINGI